MNNIYDWPPMPGETELDIEFGEWAEEVKEELSGVTRSLSKPLPDDPMRLDSVVTEEIEGWLPRVASLAVTAEYYLSQAKLEKLPEKRRAVDGKPITTESERTAVQDQKLGTYRFVRDLLDAYVVSMRERVRWTQSVRKQHGEAQGAF